MQIHLIRTYLLIYGIPLLIILFSAGLAMSSLVNRYPDLVIGITYDLTITAPLVYFFLIRKKKIPFATVVPVIVLGVILASLLLPKNQQHHLDLVKTILLPVVEICFLSVTFYHVYKFTKSFKATSQGKQDFYLILKESFVKAIAYPKVAKIFSTEIAMIYYAFISWKKRPISGNQFTGFKETGITALLLVIIFILIIETFVLHILLIKWSTAVAWIVFVLSIYTCVQILGHLKALRQRYSELTEEKLHLKYGLFGDIIIDLKNINRVEIYSNSFEDKNRKVEKLALLKDLESHNVVIYLSERQKVDKAYGITGECDTLLLHIDKKEVFVEMIQLALNNQGRG